MSSKSKSSAPEGALPAGRRLLVQLLLAAALLIAGYLAWVSLQGSGVAGCAPGSDCDKVLQSKWSSWFGVPVSVLALLLYAAMLAATWRLRPPAPAERQRAAWRILVPGAVMIIGAAVWFTGVQLIAIKAMCPYCMTAHGCGLVAATILLLSAPFRNAPEKPWQQEKQVFVPPPLGKKLAGVAVAGLAVLALGQIVHQPKTSKVTPLPANMVAKAASDAGQPPPAAAPVQPETAAPAAPARPATGRRFEIYGGMFGFDLQDVPVIGAPDAPHRMVSLFDYTCHHCRVMHGTLQQAHQVFGNQLAIVSLPMPLDSQCNFTVRRSSPKHTNACEYARLGLAVWRAKREAHEQYDQWVFAPESPPPLEAARQFAAQLVGAEALERALQDHWVNAQLHTSISLYATNLIHLRSGAMPQLVIGTNLHTGTLSAPDLFQSLEKHLGLKAKL